MPNQFADDSMTPAPISVSKDKFGNEIPSDKPMHTGATAGEGEFHFNGNQYDDSPGMGGFGKYGVSVDGDGSGKSSTVSVNVSKADRGKES